MAFEAQVIGLVSRESGWVEDIGGRCRIRMFDSGPMTSFAAFRFPAASGVCLEPMVPILLERLVQILMACTAGLRSDVGLFSSGIKNTSHQKGNRCHSIH